MRSFLRRHGISARVLAVAIAAPLVSVVLALAVVGVNPWASPDHVGAVTFTYAQRWSFPDLIRHIESGDVVAVGSPDAGSIVGQEASGVSPAAAAVPLVSGNDLIAETTSGEVIAVVASAAAPWDCCWCHSVRVR